MTEQYIIEVRLNSDELSPDKISSRHIATLIGSFEQMIAAIVARNNPSLNIDESKVTVGLSAVYHGSYRAQFQSQYDKEVRAAYEIATNAIKLQDFGDIPTKSVDAIRRIRNIAREYRTETQFGYQNGQFIELASVSANTHIEVQIPEIEGETTLYGELTSIGGIKPPKASITLLDGKKLTCNVTEREGLRVARQLGRRLYTEIGVKGLARWDLRDMSIIFFRIDEVLDYEPKSITVALENTYNSMGHHLEAIDDLEGYFVDIRNSDEDF